LINVFQLYYNDLAMIERSIIKSLIPHDSLDETTLLERLTGHVSAVQLRYLVLMLVQLCYITRVGERYMIGNQLFHNWLRGWEIDEPTPPIDDAIALDQANEEQQAIDKQIVEHQRRLRKREEQQAQMGINTPPEILTEIEDIKQKIADLQTQRSQVRASR
jgi:hypothetical protein